MSTEQDDEFDEIRGALGSIGLSAVIVLSGSILTQVMGFGTRIVMTRFLPVDGYGEIVLGITVLNILGIVSVLGLGQALTRYLPRADSDEEHSRIAAAIYQIGIGLSIVWAALGFLTADFIAGTVFGNPGMTNVVRIFALALPFYVLMRLSLRGIQGHKETTPNIVTKQLIRPGAQLAGVAALSLAGFGVLGLAFGYTLGFVLAGIVGFAFFIRVGGYQVGSLLVPLSRTRYRELLAFSVPLAISGSFGIVTKNSDRFLLGVFDVSSAVAVYDIAFILSQFILFFGPVLNYLFQPIMSEYDAENDYQRMDKLYKIITRWLVILTFPVFALLVLFPELVLETFFGAEYRAGGFALMLLAIGLYATRFVGLSGSFLTATGDTKVLMYVSGATAALNFGLNILLIPIFGIVGAAIATVSSTILNNGLQAGYVYKITRIQPFTKELLLPSALSFVCLGGMRIIIPSSRTGFFAGFLIASMLGLVLITCVFLTKSVYLIELKLVDSLLNKFGIHFNLQKRLRVFTTG